jgi:predicted nucleotidyltransferase
MKTRDEILRKLEEKQEALRLLFTVKRIDLFGSYLRGTASERSDIDLLVEFSEPTFDHYMELKFYLENLFGRTVDLVLTDTIKPRIKPIIQKDAFYV